ncbi:unnamed protein product [Closterium sp. Naga37s-1]|nr:unnamed protein product [Closterium sp. Naga37s-1]
MARLPSLGLAASVILVLLCCFSQELSGTTCHAVAHAKAILVGGKKGWPGVKHSTTPILQNTDTLVFNTVGKDCAKKGMKLQIGGG